MFGKRNNSTGASENLENEKTGELYKSAVNQKGHADRLITSVKSAKNDFYKKSEAVDPRPYIEEAAKKKKNFYGFHHSGEKIGSPCLVDESETTMELYIGSTGTGKGVFAGNKVWLNAAKGKGVIIIDPKKDNWLPQVAKEAAEKFGRSFQVASWPNNFGYSGINEEDDYLTLTNKFIAALNLEESDNPGVEHYRQAGRTALKKVLKLFLNGELGVAVKKDLKEITKHLRHLKIDLEKAEKYEKEIGKNRPNFELISKYEDRFYDTSKVESIYWSDEDIQAIDSLANKFAEISDDAVIFNGVNIDEALYDGGIIILKTDLLDNASLKMTKMLFADLLYKGRKKVANVEVIADEVSFYVCELLSGSLAVKRGLGIQYSLWAQDLSQIPDEYIGAIMSNSNVKGFYKTSDEKTLNYISAVSGKAVVSKKTIKGAEVLSALDTEDTVNTTMIRALPRTQAMTLIIEEFNEPVFTRTDFIPVEKPFDWSVWEYRDKKSSAELLKEINESSFDIDEVHYKTSLTGKVELLEDSDLFAFKFETTAL